jgi:predicted amidohydrolase
MAIRLATSQFSTTGDFLVNEARMCLQIVEARRAGADIIHFAEACLSGYAGHDFPRYSDDYDWVGLQNSVMRIAQVAASALAARSA